MATNRAPIMGRTEEAAVPFLGTDFWEEGKKIRGVVERGFKIDGRANYTLRLLTPHAVTLKDADGQPYEAPVISIGVSAGLRMAMQSAQGLRPRQFLLGEVVEVECTGETPTDKGNPMKHFAFKLWPGDERARLASGPAKQEPEPGQDDEDFVPF